LYCEEATTQEGVTPPLQQPTMSKIIAYYEHVIRADGSLARICNYIPDNPANWLFDRENPETQLHFSNGDSTEQEESGRIS
jgi:hypothetical protein